MRGWLPAVGAVGLIALHQGLSRREQRGCLPPGRRVEVAGVRLHLLEMAGEGPPLVLLAGSGTPAPCYDFRLLSDRLTGIRRVVVERPGYGYSGPGRGRRRVDDILEQDRAALRQAGIFPPYVLVPHSFAGLEAILWASRYPEEVRGVAGLDPAVPEVYRNGLPGGRAALAAAGLLWAAGRLGLLRLYPALWTGDPVWRSGGLTEAERRALRGQTVRNSMDADMLREAWSCLDSARLVGRSPVPAGTPMLFLLSCEEPPMTGEVKKAQRAFLARLAEGRAVELSCGHYIQQLAPAQAAEEIRAFWKAAAE